MIDLDIFSQGAIAALVQVIMIDLVLAGDNAVVIGLAAAGLPPEQRSRAILVGIIAATVLRIAFASIAVELLEIVGLLLAGGILLLWVCWKMWRELRGPGHKATEAALSVVDGKAPHKTFAQAAWQIVIADISMSLDNVLAVAGAARDHPTALIFDLVRRARSLAACLRLEAERVKRTPERRGGRPSGREFDDRGAQCRAQGSIA